jgi:Rrf2 family protein
MRISKRCEYGLRAVIDLGIAHEQGRTWVPAHELASHERIPVAFLEQILLELAKAELLRSRRGPQGGYALARAAAAVCACS